jgi:hypothetical protein
MKDLEKALQDAGIRLDSWGEAKPKADLFQRERELLEKLEKVLLVQIEADKSSITDLQIALNKLENNRGK